MTDLLPLKIKAISLLLGIQGDLELRCEAMNGNDIAKELFKEQTPEERKKILSEHIKGLKYSINGINAIYDALLEVCQELQKVKDI